MIDFNRPYFTGKETQYILQAVKSGKISGDGMFTQKCQNFFRNRYGFKKTLLTTSCTDALEMCAILTDVKQGDEVIVPSYTFASTALAFVRQGAKIVFADSHKDRPGIDENKIEELITPKTKVIVPVHYAGIACDMDKIMLLSKKYNLLVVEDAAQAIDSFYKGRPLGSIGHLAAFSFQETKNVSSGEGGLLAINDKRFIRRSEIVWDVGTNRVEFFRGEVSHYSWVDIGSSFLPSEIVAAYLWAQLENIDRIQKKRIEIWQKYFKGLSDWAIDNGVRLPEIPGYATNNAHMFYMVCKSRIQRNEIMDHLKKHGVGATSHYLSLHRSPYYKNKHDGRKLPNSDHFEKCLIRLPLFYELKQTEVEKIIGLIKQI